MMWAPVDPRYMRLVDTHTHAWGHDTTNSRGTLPSSPE